MDSPKKTPHDGQLHLKDVLTIVAILSFVGGLYVWGNSAIVIPTVLQKARQQTREEIHDHESKVHEGSFSQREFRLWSEQIMNRLETIERLLK